MNITNFLTIPTAAPIPPAGFKILHYLISNYGQYPSVDECQELDPAVRKYVRRGCDTVSLTAVAGKDEANEDGTWYTEMRTEWNEDTGLWLAWS